MLGYDYVIIYKKGKEHAVINALSRKFDKDGSFFALSLPIPSCLKEARREWLENDTIVQLI